MSINLSTTMEHLVHSTSLSIALFITYVQTFFSNGLLYQFTNTILDRFCLEILPKIHDKIEFLDLESSSIKRILLLTNYPNLYGLGLYDLATETAKDLFTGK
ncbi:unnamed protein product [Rotaria sordida]|uniref:Uncharacterized protein n=1 Tax=Rotaria sordida TaxID=392033 RepID=A0A814VZP1_9BILA|nr:unnamed protein product [Rotaria sordida]CAF1590000.1 unnamed protein product [Rotaria sordida]